MTDKTDSKERGGIISSSDILLHDATTALMYEELRAAIDDGHESMTHADALAEIAAIRAENVELRAQVDSIGAGGVSGPLMGKPQEMPDLTTLTERGAKAWAGVDAQGLRDGVASAGSEPVAQLASERDELFQAAIDFIRTLTGMEPPPIEVAPPNVFAPFHAFVNTVQAITNKRYRPPLGGVARPCHVFNVRKIGPRTEWTPTTMALALPDGEHALYTHPSPPEGMVGGWTKASQQLPPCRDDQLYLGINTAGFAGVFNAVADIAGNVHCIYETPEETIDVMSSLDIWQPFTPPTSSADSRKGE